MAYSKIENGVLIKFDERDLVNGHYTIPSEVVQLGARAFYTCRQLESVEIPSTVEKIGNLCFAACFNLKKVSIAEGVEEIGEHAFRYVQIHEITIPGSVKALGTSVFEDCGALEKVVINEGLTSLPEACFRETKSLAEVVLPSTLRQVGYYAFAASNIEKIKIPDGVDTILSHAFYQSRGLKKIQLPASLRQIQDFVFCDCSHLEEVMFEDAGNLELIMAGAFAGCSKLKKFDIPESVKMIETACFKDCNALEEIVIPYGITTIPISLCEGCVNLSRLVIPETVTSIKDEAFKYCESLESVVLPEGLKEIEQEAFEFCQSLRSVNLPDSIERLGRSIFAGCTALESSRIPLKITQIPHSIFMECENLKMVEMHEGIVKISGQSFDGCKSLSTIGIPKVVTYIGHSAFKNCSSLKSIELPEGLTQIDDAAFKDSGIKGKITIPRVATKLGLEMFEGCEGLNIEFYGREMSLERFKVFEKAYSINPYFVGYTFEHKKTFLPKNMGIIAATKNEEIPNFYSHVKQWSEILTNYTQRFDCSQEEEAIASLYQLCTVLGLFQDNRSEIAKKFILENIVSIPPRKLHQYLGSFNTRKLGYVDEYARFFIQNYHPPVTEIIEDVDCVEIPFLYKYDDSEDELVNCVDMAYNQWWSKVKEVYPNKEVVPHREGRSEATNITEEDVLNALNMVYYDNIEPGCEKLAEMVGIYGYTQKEFETIQKWFLQAKAIKPEEMKLFCGQDTATKGIKFELMAKDDEETTIIGEKTNCCQVVDDAGAECMHYGMVKPNSGFIKFTLDGKIIGQSWVWYNEDTKEICLDNIEMPKRLEKKINDSPNYYNSFIECLIRLAESFEKAMKAKGLEVERVTVGKGYTELEALKDNFQTIDTLGKEILPKDYNASFTEVGRVYSDAKYQEFKISGVTLNDIFGDINTI